ncbi:unnamed protein product [Callosobruchus maculatus]|uniref:Endonuclease/exonuclease/phosphatase domain-containing protein n=1 Tax=Callosobruchus maculatus TaxID=64391 RepID=A0A653DWT8_CALMS|nr:unnamed protein product [Callosobruchus maculatus]
MNFHFYGQMDYQDFATISVRCEFNCAVVTKCVFMRLFFIYDGYDVYRKDRKFDQVNKTCGGGVLLALRKSIRSTVIDTSIFDIQFPSIDMLTVKCSSEFQTLFVVVLYIPDKVGLDEFEHFIESLEQLDFISRNSVLILGDFNVPKLINMNRADRKTAAVINLLELNDLQQYNKTTNSLGRILDLVIKMSSKFACCKSKDVLYYICINCLGVYHHSCANRLRGIKKLTGNRIICCSRSETDDNNETDMKLHEEIERLKTELVDKENFITRLQKTAKDFENDVLEIEQKFVDEQKAYKEQLKVQKEKLCIMHQDLIKSENKNTELLIRMDDYKKQLSETEKIINELRSIESEMLTSMSVLEQTNETYAKEIDSFHRRSGAGKILASQDQREQEHLENLSSLASIIGNELTPQGASDMVPNKTSAGLAEFVTNVEVSLGMSAAKTTNTWTSVSKKVLPKQKKKIVVVGDELSRNVARLLNIHLNPSEFEAKGIVKCNADFHEISKTVVSRITPGTGIQGIRGHLEGIFPDREVEIEALPQWKNGRTESFKLKIDKDLTEDNENPNTARRISSNNRSADTANAGIKDISIMNFNVQCIRNKILILEDFIKSVSGLKVLCITEHWLREDELSCYNIPGFALKAAYCRVVHIHGGVSIYIHETLAGIELKKIKDLSQELHCEMTAVFIRKNTACANLHCNECHKRPEPSPEKLEEIEQRDTMVCGAVALDRNRSTSDVSEEVGPSNKTFSLILKRRGFKCFAYRSTQELFPHDHYRRMVFCETMMEKANQDNIFLKNILFKDESSFPLHGNTMLHKICVFKKD